MIAKKNNKNGKKPVKKTDKTVNIEEKVGKKSKLKSAKKACCKKFAPEEKSEPSSTEGIFFNENEGAFGRVMNDVNDGLEEAVKEDKSGAAIGGLAGALLGGVVGALLGGIIGAVVESKNGDDNFDIDDEDDDETDDDAEDEEEDSDEDDDEDSGDEDDDSDEDDEDEDEDDEDDGEDED